MTLDAESSRRRGSKVDFVVRIGYDQIEPEDVDMLSSLMGLSDVQVGALYTTCGGGWARAGSKSCWPKAKTTRKAPPSWTCCWTRASSTGGTLGAIQRKLGLFRRFDFLQPRVARGRGGQDHGRTSTGGMHVVLEFGRYGSTLEAYILVANYLTRRIHERYVQRKEAALGEQSRGAARRWSSPSRRRTSSSTRPSPGRRSLAPSPASCASTTSRCSSSTSGPAASTRR